MPLQLTALQEGEDHAGGKSQHALGTTTPVCSLPPASLPPSAPAKLPKGMRRQAWEVGLGPLMADCESISAGAGGIGSPVDP